MPPDDNSTYHESSESLSPFDITVCWAEAFVLIHADTVKFDPILIVVSCATCT